MALSDIDRRLLERCTAREQRSWEDFVDRFLGLVLHVVNHTVEVRGQHLNDEDREDLVAEVFLALIHDDFAVLRRFRGESSLATYLTVIARRIVVRSLQQRRNSSHVNPYHDEPQSDDPPTEEKRINDRDELERLLARLNGPEAEVVRLYHLEGKTYREISAAVGMPENSVGPTLSRARSKMRQASADTPMT